MDTRAMTSVTIDLPEDVERKVRSRAAETGRPAHALAARRDREWRWRRTVGRGGQQQLDGVRGQVNADNRRQRITALRDACAQVAERAPE